MLIDHLQCSSYITSSSLILNTCLSTFFFLNSWPAEPNFLLGRSPHARPTCRTRRMAAAKSLMRRLPRASFFYGPMAAGKTSALIRKVREIQRMQPDIQILAYRPEIDTRAPEGQILSRDGTFLENVKKCNNFKTVEPIEDSLLVLDEAHFCNNDDVLGLFHRAIETKNCSFFVAGLDRNFRGEKFGPMLDMVEVARKSMIEHEVYALNAQCYICQEPAAFSKRLVSNDEVFLVGGDDVYQPVCKKHFYE